MYQQNQYVFVSLVQSPRLVVRYGGYVPTPPPPAGYPPQQYNSYDYYSQQQQYVPNAYQQQYDPNAYQQQQQYDPNTYQQQQAYYYQQQQQPAPPPSDTTRDSQEPSAATQQDPQDHSPPQEPPPPGTVDETAKTKPPEDKQDTVKEESLMPSGPPQTNDSDQKGPTAVESSAQSSQWTGQNQLPQQQQQNYQQGYPQGYQGYPQASTWQSQGQGDSNAYQWGQYQWSMQGWQQQQQQQAPQQWNGGMETWAGQQWSQSQPQAWDGKYAQQNQGASYQPTQGGVQSSWQQEGQAYSYQQGYQPSQATYQQSPQPPQQPTGEPFVPPSYSNPPSGVGPGEEQKQPLLPTPPQSQTPESKAGGHERPAATPPGRKRKRGSRWNAPEKQDPPPRWTPPKEQGPPPNQPYASVPPPNHTPPTRHTPTPRQSPTPPTPPLLEDRTPTPPPLPDQPRGSAPDSWPPRLQHYIARAFGACHNDQQKDSVERFLKVELRDIFEEKREWKINWDTYPLPMDPDYQEHCIKRKRHSRWDTPSPSGELKGMPLPPQLPPRPLEDIGAEEEGGRGMPAGRGKRRRKKKKGKNKFFLDNQPDGGFVMSVEDKQKIDQRAQRFGKGSEGNRNFRKKLSINELVKVVNGSNLDESEINWQDFAIEGSSEALEKSYLRLTSAPDPSTVRPERVLKLSLEHVKGKWKAGKDYRYICEQFKSIRQDLTIQGIRNSFTVEVYETHGRVAAENGDREEFNQCQTQLKALYSEGISGNIAEFVAYRIFYLILTNSTADISSVLKELEPGLSSEPCVAHALKLRSSWALGNYHRFFKLYHSAPNMGSCLMDMFVERERKAALKAMAKAFRPNVKVEYISQELGFASQEDCLAFLSSVGAVLDSTGLLLDCKLTSGKMV